MGRFGRACRLDYSFTQPSRITERNNFICRSLWMNDDLPQESRPFAMQGENIGDGIIVDWNQDYEKWATFLKAHESTKEALLF